jgi:cytoskeletal protein CcmA (bactofilin family)
MFSKSRPTDSGTRQDAGRERSTEPQAQQPQEQVPLTSRAEPKQKPPASVLSADLQIKGNVQTSGDVTIEGQVEGDIRAQLLTVGETATVKGEVIAEDVVVNGRIVGRVRGMKVRLTATARVEGDIVHKTIAIESGAHFEGSVMRQDDPLQGSGPDRRVSRQEPEQRQPVQGAAE